MGRVKTKLLKTATIELMNRYGEKFERNFESNKTIVATHADVSSKKLRNVIAGYATRLKKTGKY